MLAFIQRNHRFIPKIKPLADKVHCDRYLVAKIEIDSDASYIMQTAFKCFLCIFLAVFFPLAIKAQPQISSQPSLGCTIFAIGQGEFKYICNEFDITLDVTSEVATLSMQREGSTTLQRIILEEKEEAPELLIKFSSSIRVVENCKPTVSCFLNPTSEDGDILTLECPRGIGVYSMHRGLFLENQEPLKTSEIGEVAICVFDQGITALILAELFAIDPDAFLISPKSIKTE